MQSISKLSKLFVVTAITASTLLTYPDAAYASHHHDSKATEERLDMLEKRVNLLEKDEIVYGPITISDTRLGDSKQSVTLAPGQKIECCFRYKVDASQLDFLSKTHLIVGLKNVAAQTCVQHAYGVFDSTGTAKFELLAPLEVGDYEVRIASLPGDKCEDAFNAWNVLGEEPSSYATIGIVRVRNP